MTEELTSKEKSVAPRMGAWIETNTVMKNYITTSVAPRMGAWIETEKCR